MTNRRRLKNLFLNPGFQLRYVLLVSGAALFLALCNAGVFYFYTRENYAILVDLSPMTDEVKAQLYRELREIVLYLTLFSFGFVAFVSLLALYLSHRAAGPLYHFKRVFDEIGGGKPESRIQLRPGDDFHEVAASFNRMMDRVSSRK